MSENVVMQRLGLFVRGLAMGAADVVPGVSGGTVALITGIYAELLTSLSRADTQALSLLRKLQFKSLWTYINGTFLLCVFSGVLLSIITLAQGITYLLASYPIALWSFFFGLILISALLLAKHVPRWTFSMWLFLGIGIAFAWYITVASPIALEPSPQTFFFAGMLAVTAMILPGISGSFILLLLGLYAPILEKVKVLAPEVFLVLAGCVMGLLIFSKFLHYLLEKHGAVTMAFLTGLLLGSLNKVWPWKETLSTRLDSHGELIPVLQRSIMPGTYENLMSQNAQLSMAVFMMLVGLVSVLFIIYLTTWAAKKD